MSEKLKLRILVVDDHSAMREGLCLLIDDQSDMEVVGQAGDGQQALQQIRDCRPDVVVMDISMPNLDGGRATERIKQTHPDVKVLVLTRHEETGYLRRMLEAGAAGYALKRASGADLLGAIRAIAGSVTYIDPGVADKLIESYVGKSVNNKSRLQSSLTVRETEILKLVARGDSNKEIAYSLSISVKTVEAHKTHAMIKLGLHNRAGIIRYALISGWLEE